MSSMHDLMVAFRRLWRSPLFTLFAVVSLAAGVAVTTAVYALVADIFWKPLVVSRPDQLMVLGSQVNGRLQYRSELSPSDVEEYLRSQQSLATIATSSRVGQAMTVGANFEELSASAVSGSYFEVLGTTPQVGRLLTPLDDRAGAPAVAVLSDRLWRRAFGADPAVVGRVITLSSHAIEIVGVTAAGFNDLDAPGGGFPANSRAWIPATTAATMFRSSVTSAPPDLTLVGRLRAGATREQASSEATVISAALDRTAPVLVARNGSSRQEPRRWAIDSIARIMDAQLSGRPTITAYVLIGIGALVLVIACTNLASLSLARGAARQHEFAVRRSLGASRERLVRELLLESAIVAVLGGLASVVFLKGLLHLLTVDLPLSNQQMASLAPAITLPALIFSGMGVLLSLVVFGLQPALQLTRDSERADLASGAQTIVSAPRGSWRLIRWQVGIACALLLVASVAVQYVVILSRDTSGIDLDHLAVGTVVTIGPRWPESSARATVTAIVDRLHGDPAIESAAAATGMPFGMTTTPYVTVGDADKPGARQDSTILLAATPDLFKTLRITVQKGRAFVETDSSGSPPVAILSAAEAVELFGTTEVVGHRMTMRSLGGTEASRVVTIVGVANDTDVQSRMSRHTGIVYAPLTQQFSPGITIAVRTSNLAAGVAAIRSAVSGEAPDLVVRGAGPATDMLAPALPVTRFVAVLGLGLGGLALLLGMIGLHGVLAHVLAMRTREMGLRIALGATSRQLEGMALLQGLRPVLQGLGIGIVLGTLARIGISRLSRGGVGMIDPIATVVVPVLFVIAAGVACVVPARRAARVDPNIVLKAM